MVGATGLEPVTPAVSRHGPVFVAQTRPTFSSVFYQHNRC